MMMSASANLGQCYLFIVNRDQMVAGVQCLVQWWCVQLPSYNISYIIAQCTPTACFALLWPQQLLHRGTDNHWTARRSGDSFIITTLFYAHLLFCDYDDLALSYYLCILVHGTPFSQKSMTVFKHMTFFCEKIYDTQDKLINQFRGGIGVVTIEILQIEINSFQ